MPLGDSQQSSKEIITKSVKYKNKSLSWTLPCQRLGRKARTSVLKHALKNSSGKPFPSWGNLFAEDRCCFRQSMLTRHCLFKAILSVPTLHDQISQALVKTLAKGEGGVKRCASIVPVEETS